MAGPFTEDDVQGYPHYAAYKKGGPGLFRKSLRQDLRGGGQSLEDLYRTMAFRDIGNQQTQARDMARRSVAAGFGSNTPTGLLPALEGQIALSAPYGEANLGAAEAARRAKNETGRELELSRQRQANWWATLVAPSLQQRALDLQELALESQNAFGLAGAQGGGFGGGVLGGLFG